MLKSEPKEATTSHMKLLEMPALSESMPFSFEDTGFMVETLELTCGHCGGDIPTSQSFGSVSRMMPAVVDLDLMGMCPKCQVATPFRIRIRSNRLVDWRDADGTWQTFTVYAPNRSGLKHALSDFFTALKKRWHQKYGQVN